MACVNLWPSAFFLKYACIAALALAIAWPGPAKGQPEAEDSPYQPGLIAAYRMGDRQATRIDEGIAFDWKDAACDLRLPPGDFTAVWRGRLWARGAGTYTIACYVQGEVKITLAGKTVISGRTEERQWLASQPLELDFDYHPLEVSFRRTQPTGQLALFWSGPDFRLEPIPERALLHEREQTPSIEFERGRQLAAALRCAACHKDENASASPAPALDRLSGNLHESWLSGWLTSSNSGHHGASFRRMPDFGLTTQEADAVAAWLLREPAVKSESKKNEQKETKVTKEETKKAEKSGKKSKGEEKPKPSAAEGERLILSRGCLACHKFGELGESGLFGGGDLTGLFTKRPADFLNRWLVDPAAINKNHRMPVFSFTSDELTSLALWAKEHSHQPEAQARSPAQEAIGQGERLVGTLKCASCHSLTSDQKKTLAPSQRELTAASNWDQSCAREPRRDKLRPGYHLAAEDQKALRAYYSASRPSEGKLSPQARGRDLLVQINCLGCHQREGVNRAAAVLPPVLQDKLVAVSDAHSELAPLVPAMTPPALNSVGDKLQDTALADAITRKGPPHRPYLLVQMPKFNLSSDQLASLTAYFVTTDRIPNGAGFQPAKETVAGQRPAPQALAAAGPRLVTTDGLACTSCHQVGSVLPSKAPLNARGPDMSMLGKRIRREWFDRWCDNPARIVPRMEMPAVKVPVRGVLNDKIDDQLAAVWHILNTPGFEPPEPNPVRVLRLSGIPEKNERPIVIHDVVKDGDKTYLYPLVIGLPNRHNILFDLETNRLAAWWLGDTARQRTKGKSWYWEMGGKSIFDPHFNESELSVIVRGTEYSPKAEGQFSGVFESMAIRSDSRLSVDFRSKLNFQVSKTGSSDANSMRLESYSQFTDRSGGFVRRMRISGKGEVSELRFRLVARELLAKTEWESDSRTLEMPELKTSIRLVSPIGAVWNGDGTVSVRAGDIQRYGESGTGDFISEWVLEYITLLPADEFLTNPAPPMVAEATTLSVAPGFAARRLPLDSAIMPSAFAWNARGELFFTTLKGEIIRATDSTSDGLEDQWGVMADGLATPYGIYAVDEEELVDVAAKDGVLRIPYGMREPTFAKPVWRVASGWGHTDDYHDWAVGLVRGQNGEYYLALPCQQDQRSEQAAQLRGKLLKLVPRELQGNFRLFNVEVISSGHRFPMGLARNRDGELFVTDNQGNYNPFNELNHVKKGAHFGFINALEKEHANETGYKPPPLTPPAINIPHPWTRSVNGICFLDTPTLLAGTKPGPGASPTAPPSPTSPPSLDPSVPPSLHHSLYGPLEGHLIGCEYDTRRLIRMSLQKVGDTYQGAAYPLSIPSADVEKGLLGPIVCAIKPTTGELYVGEIRDSGWGAGNNIGQIVKIKIEPDKLPCGIAEVQATKTGFTIDFFRPVDRAKASDVGSYSIQSYRRESTPAYGGPDIDRRAETINAAQVSADGKRVTLTLPELRAGGHVYEIRVKNVAPGDDMFHPDEAHYTMNNIPE
jgi:mono/diheme cytochrome c family protein